MTPPSHPGSGRDLPGGEDIDLLVRFGENLLRIRQARKLSQEALAERAGIHRTQLSLLENGRRQPRLNTLSKLAGALDVPVSMLLEGIAFVPASDGGEYRVLPSPELPRVSAQGRSG